MSEYDDQYCGLTYAFSGVYKHSLKEGGPWFKLPVEADIGYRKVPEFYLYFRTFPIYTTNDADADADDGELDSIRHRLIVVAL